MTNGNGNIVLNIDSLMPAEMAEKAERIGVLKASMGPRNMFMLSVLAGAFIALGAIFYTTVTADAAGNLSYGMTRLVGGLAFCLGLILVVVAGAELFTGNNLIVMAWASRRITLIQVLRNWAIVYFGNFVGAVATALFIFLSGQYMGGSGAVGVNALNIAAGKTALGFHQALLLGVMCNALVCLAVWLCFSARTVTDKILAIIFPISAFVAAGFEHSVANMYFIPIGLFINKHAPPEFWEAAGRTATDLDWAGFMGNLIPVTLGNIIGGSVMVGLVYWFTFIRPKHRTT